MDMSDKVVADSSFSHFDCHKMAPRSQYRLKGGDVLRLG